ncbi:MAG TPA: type II secretion system protein GspM [Gemmatimonadales bacterium]|nr:type II secretion system protein GspM [Gemmatimonadales bacterium]
MSRIGSRDRRALLLGLGAVVLALLAFRGVPLAVRGVDGLRDRAAGQTATLARVEDVVLRGPAVRDSLTDALQGIVSLAPELVDGTTAADAQASLSGLVSLVANRHALKVLRADALPDSAVGVFHRAAIHAELEGDLGGVTAFLRSIETGEPLLTVSSISLETPDPLSYRRTPEVLHLFADVSGYYLPRDK